MKWQYIWVRLRSYSSTIHAGQYAAGMKDMYIANLSWWKIFIVHVVPLLPGIHMRSLFFIRFDHMNTSCDHNFQTRKFCITGWGHVSTCVHDQLVPWHACFMLHALLASATFVASGHLLYTQHPELDRTFAWHCDDRIAFPMGDLFLQRWLEPMQAER